MPRKYRKIAALLIALKQESIYDYVCTRVRTVAEDSVPAPSPWKTSVAAVHKR